MRIFFLPVMRKEIHTGEQLPEEMTMSYVKVKNASHFFWETMTRYTSMF